eukprot:TRINITY_DN15986_c0_g1_i1.p1 TRINITY_DN15986_c0_g1~~TRINITY_DN15986_c0_g1_i1.p1  ORF type:complete len:178 (+),score=52.29 TRINITY_DN15986_c0_g1_i1:69-602(+)
MGAPVNGALSPKLRGDALETWQAELCMDQPGRLEGVVEGYSAGDVLSALVEYTNRVLDKEEKRFVFRNKKCRRCSQASTGGKKATWEVEVRADHAAWLRIVQERCDIPTVDKVLRIIVDFYALHAGGPPLGEAATHGLRLLRERSGSEAPPAVLPDSPVQDPPAKRQKTDVGVATPA